MFLVQKIFFNDRAEIRVNTKISTDIEKILNKPDSFVVDKKTKEILIVEVGINNIYLLTIVDIDKRLKCEFLKIV